MRIAMRELEEDCVNTVGLIAAVFVSSRRIRGGQGCEVDSSCDFFSEDERCKRFIVHIPKSSPLQLPCLI